MQAIVDTFSFFNELEILEMRLYELAPVVDKFILVEATTTHSGNPKPLYFEENKSQFKNYKIDHFTVELPNIHNPSREEVGRNEGFQRDQIVLGLADCDSDDTVIISDLDEIPNRELVPNLPGYLKEEFSSIKIRQRLHLYYLNMISDELWNGPCVIKRKFLDEITPTQLRNAIWSPDMPVVDGGWHLSYMGGIDRIRYKIESYMHVEYNTDYYKDPHMIQLNIDNGMDLFDRDARIVVSEIDDTYPHLIREQPDKFKNLIRGV